MISNARISISSGVASLIDDALAAERSPEHTCLLNGDLDQMSKQKAFLLGRGFDVKQNDAYPSLKNEDFKPALTAIFNDQVEGWWNYQTQLIELGICSREDYLKALGN